MPTLQRTIKSITKQLNHINNLLKEEEPDTKELDLRCRKLAFSTRDFCVNQPQDLALSLIRDLAVEDEENGSGKIPCYVRKNQEGIDLLFPTYLGDMQGNIMAWDRIGGHAQASPDLIRELDKPFNPIPEDVGIYREAYNANLVLL